MFTYIPDPLDIKNCSYNQTVLWIRGCFIPDPGSG
jgi:hypothetical protein